MDFRKAFFLVALSSGLTFFGPISQGFGQAPAAEPASAGAMAAVPDAPLPQSSSSSSTQTEQDKSHEHQSPTAPDLQRKASETPAGVPATQKPEPLPEPKRILGIMPNYRAVSAGVLPPPPTSKEAFVVATQNSFDYSGFFFVGITSLLAEGTEAHPQLGKGIPGFWAYSWRGFVDKADGNYWVIWALPTVIHEDERYYAKGEGTIVHRGFYAASRILITPNYHGKNTFNAAEIFGRGISQAISLTYYPSADQSFEPYMEKYGYAVGRDALTNVFREFWPDIDAHVLHRHRAKQSGLAGAN
ncbi:MAG: hypothetical protein ACLGSH_17435 [Acidobacteriota bacterium]